MFKNKILIPGKTSTLMSTIKKKRKFGFTG